MCTRCSTITDTVHRGAKRWWLCRSRKTRSEKNKSLRSKIFSEALATLSWTEFQELDLIKSIDKCTTFLVRWRVEKSKWWRTLQRQAPQVIAWKWILIKELLNSFSFRGLFPPRSTLVSPDARNLSAAVEPLGWNGRWALRVSPKKHQQKRTGTILQKSWRFSMKK